MFPAWQESQSMDCITIYQNSRTASRCTEKQVFFFWTPTTSKSVMIALMTWLFPDLPIPVMNSSNCLTVLNAKCSAAIWNAWDCSVLLLRPNSAWTCSIASINSALLIFDTRICSLSMLSSIQPMSICRSMHICHFCGESSSGSSWICGLFFFLFMGHYPAMLLQVWLQPSMYLNALPRKIIAWWHCCIGHCVFLDKSVYVPLSFWESIGDLQFIIHAMSVQNAQKETSIINHTIIRKKLRERCSVEHDTFSIIKVLISICINCGQCHWMVHLGILALGVHKHVGYQFLTIRTELGTMISFAPSVIRLAQVIKGSPGPEEQQQILIKFVCILVAAITGRKIVTENQWNSMCRMEF